MTWPKRTRLNAIKKFRVAPGFKVELVANEPQLENPVAFHIGNDGKIYVSETGRYRSSAIDIRHYMSWYDDDLAARTVDDRIALIKKHAGEDWQKLQVETETVRLLDDKDGDGVAEFSSVFAAGFTNILDGIASGVMAKDGWVTSLISRVSGVCVTTMMMALRTSARSCPTVTGCTSV